jgi:preprotein translocase subunit YajC
MKICVLTAVVLGLALGAASAQDAPATPPEDQAPASSHSHGAGGGQGQHQRGMWNGGGGITGTVTEVAANHYVIKTDAGENYTIRLSADTRILRQSIQRRGEGGGNSVQTLKPGDIKVGDAIALFGETDAAAKSISAAVVLQVDPERIKQMREMQASFGKTWLMGKVTAINETRITLQSTVDNAAHAFQADENTVFRKRRVPITLADVQVGDMVRVEGAVKDGIFIASSVSVMGPPPAGTPAVPRIAPPPPPPPGTTQPE